MSSISSNTFTNRQHINDNSRVKRETRALLVVTKKQKRNDDDANDVFNVVNDFDAANEIEKNVDDNELANNEHDVDEIFDVVNDDEIVRRETNVDEDFFRDVFHDRDNNNAFEKCKRF
jgi:membrane-associated HD superfamily phosphohydrolase